MSGQAAQTVTDPMTRWRRNIRLIRNKKTWTNLSEWSRVIFKSDVPERLKLEAPSVGVFLETILDAAYAVIQLAADLSTLVS